MFSKANEKQCLCSIGVSRIIGSVFILSLGVISFFAIRGNSTPWINQDVAVHMMTGELILNGKAFFIDWYDANVPSIHLLHAGSFALSSILGISPVLGFYWVTLIFGALGLWFLERSIHQAENLFTFLAVAIAYLSLVVRPNPTLATDFGQREQIFALIFIPYFIGKFGKQPGSAGVALYYFLVGWISTFKPQMLAAVVCVEAAPYAWSFWKKERPPSIAWLPTLFLTLGIFAPFLFILVLNPASFSAFFAHALDFNSYYQLGSSKPSFAGVLKPEFVLAGALTVLFLWVSLQTVRINRNYLRPIVLMGVLILLNYAGIFWQRRFYSYHWDTLWGFLLVAVVYLLCISLRNKSHRLTLATALLVYLAFGTVQFANLIATPVKPSFPLATFVRPGDKVMFFSMNVRVNTQALYMKANRVGPWFSHFTLGGMLRTAHTAETARDFAEYQSQLKEAIATEKPDWIFFDEANRFMLPPNETIHGVMTRTGVIPQQGYVRLDDHSINDRSGGSGGWIAYQATSLLVTPSLSMRSSYSNTP